MTLDSIACVRGSVGRSRVRFLEQEMGLDHSQKKRFLAPALSQVKSPTENAIGAESKKGWGDNFVLNL